MLLWVWVPSSHIWTSTWAESLQPFYILWPVGGARGDAGEGDEAGVRTTLTHNLTFRLAHGHFLQKSWGAVGGVGVENQFHFPLLRGGRIPSCPVLPNGPRGRGLGEHTGHRGGFDHGVSRKWCYQADSTFHPMPLDKRKSAQGGHTRVRERGQTENRIFGKNGSVKMITMDEQWPF